MNMIIMNGYLMDDKIKITRLYKDKIKNLKKHNSLYFNYDKPIISDSEYDNLKNEIKELEKENKYLNIDYYLILWIYKSVKKKIICPKY